MERYEAVALFHVVEEGPFLVGFDVVDVGVQQERVVFLQRRRIEVFELVGIGERDAAAAENWL